jgi:hypothetical protein
MEISPEFVEGATRRFVMRGVKKESVLVLVSFLLVGHPSAFYDQMGPDKRFDAAEVWALAKQFDIKGVTGWLEKQGMQGKNIPAALDFAMNAMCAKELEFNARNRFWEKMKVEDLQELVNEEGDDVFSGLSLDLVQSVQLRFVEKAAYDFLVKWSEAQKNPKNWYTMLSLNPDILSSYSMKEGDFIRLKNCGFVPPTVTVHVKWLADDDDEDVKGPPPKAHARFETRKPTPSAAQKAALDARSDKGLSAAHVEFDVEKFDPFVSARKFFDCIKEAVQKKIPCSSADRRWTLYTPIDVWLVCNDNNPLFGNRAKCLWGSQKSLISQGIGSEGWVVYASFVPLQKQQ